MRNELRILVYGAGVIGSIFAGKLSQSGYKVTVLARGKRLEQVRRNGIILENPLSGRQIQCPVSVTETLGSEDEYDFIIVAVQNTQIDAVLPVLAANKSKNLVLVVNNPCGYQNWIDALGYDRIIIGFPSAGGERQEGIVRCFIGRGPVKLFQSTTFGELSGTTTPRLKQLLKIFRNSGFSPTSSKNMNAWQKTHVAVVLPIARALYCFNSNNYQLARSADTVRRMILATRECFAVLRAMNVEIVPKKLSWYYLPLFVLVPIFRMVLHTRMAEYAMAKHTLTAREELTVLEKSFRRFINTTGVSTENLDSLN